MIYSPALCKTMVTLNWIFLIGIQTLNAVVGVYKCIGFSLTIILITESVIIVGLDISVLDYHINLDYRISRQILMSLPPILELIFLLMFFILIFSILGKI